MLQFKTSVMHDEAAKGMNKTQLPYKMCFFFIKTGHEHAHEKDIVRKEIT